MFVVEVEIVDGIVGVVTELVCIDGVAVKWGTTTVTEFDDTGVAIAGFVVTAVVIVVVVDIAVVSSAVVVVVVAVVVGTFNWAEGGDWLGNNVEVVSVADSIVVGIVGAVDGGAIKEVVEAAVVATFVDTDDANVVIVALVVKAVVVTFVILILLVGALMLEVVDVLSAFAVLLLLVSGLDSLSKNDCNSCGLSMTSSRQRFWSIIHNKQPLY